MLWVLLGQLEESTTKLKLHIRSLILSIITVSSQLGLTRRLEGLEQILEVQQYRKTCKGWSLSMIKLKYNRLRSWLRMILSFLESHNLDHKQRMMVNKKKLSRLVSHSQAQLFKQVTYGLYFQGKINPILQSWTRLTDTKEQLLLQEVLLYWFLLEETDLESFPIKASQFDNIWQSIHQQLESTWKPQWFSLCRLLAPAKRC